MVLRVRYANYSIPARRFQKKLLFASASAQMGGTVSIPIKNSEVRKD